MDEHGRPQPPVSAGEVASILGFLDYQRATLAWKCAGLDAAGLNTKVAAVKEAKDGVAVTFEGQLPEGMAKEQIFDRVLVSVGRRPNSAVPGLDKTRVKVNQRGFIQVDQARATAEPTIYAIGDVVGEPMLAHKASHEARVAIDAILGERVAFEPLAIPAVVFTDPEVAWCGLTENEAARQKALAQERARNSAFSNSARGINAPY